MKKTRWTAAWTAAVFSAAVLCRMPAKAAELNAEGYDISGFAAAFPERFSKDDTVTVTDHSYQSHDVSLEITKHESISVSGDVNEDSKVDLSDAVIAERLAVSDFRLQIPITGMKNADCNADGIVSADDANLMLQWLGGELSQEEFVKEQRLVYFVTDVYIRDIDSLRGAFAQGHFPEHGTAGNKRVEEMANENSAIFAINCDYCEIRDNGITWRNGVMYRETKRGEVAVLYRDGTMEVLTDAEYRELTAERKAQIWQTTAFGPGLVKDGQAVTSFSSGVPMELHPRSGIGYYEPGHYCFVQVEGRQEGYSDGITCLEFAQIFLQLGCTEAYNMDGGSSSEIVFQGKTYNQPAWGGRPSSDILYICEIPE